MIRDQRTPFRYTLPPAPGRFPWVTVAVLAIAGGGSFVAALFFLFRLLLR